MLQLSLVGVGRAVRRFMRSVPTLCFAGFFLKAVMQPRGVLEPLVLAVASRAPRPTGDAAAMPTSFSVATVHRAAAVVPVPLVAVAV
jgi:hypothetical protein